MQKTGSPNGCGMLILGLMGCHVTARWSGRGPVAEGLRDSECCGASHCVDIIYDVDGYLILRYSPRSGCEEERAKNHVLHATAKPGIHRYKRCAGERRSSAA